MSKEKNKRKPVSRFKFGLYFLCLVIGLWLAGLTLGTQVSGSQTNEFRLDLTRTIISHLAPTTIEQIKETKTMVPIQTQLAEIGITQTEIAHVEATIKAQMQPTLTANSN